MASISERKYSSGRVTYKVSLRKLGIKGFSITFDDLEEACDWIENNEKEYYKNPDKYFLWRESAYYKMQRERKKGCNHLLKPKFKMY